MNTLETQDYRFCPQCFEAYELPADQCPTHKVPLVRLRYPEGSLKGRLIDGKYVILDLLGRGGMGVVYRARQMPIKREVAFKVLNREFLAHPASVKRFIREASAASMLRSRFSAIVHDFGLAREGFLYFTMEVARGSLLSDAVQGNNPLDADQACLVSMDICRSLEEAHSYGIIHRDMKPGNIMLIQGEDRVMAKVLDFGTARLLETRAPDRITDPGKVFGTPEYMAPEQAMGEDTGPTADLYALGVMLYEMLTGKLPFSGKTHTHLLLKQIKEKPRSMQVMAPERDIPDSLDHLVRSLLEKQPKRRPQTAREVRVTLSEILREHFPESWESTPGIPSPTRPVDVKPAPISEGPNTLPSFGALTPEMILEDQPDELHRPMTLEMGAATNEDDEFEVPAFVPEAIEAGEAIQTGARPRDEVNTGPPPGRRRRRLVASVGFLLIFGVVIAGGWRVAQTILQDHGFLKPQAETNTSAPRSAEPVVSTPEPAEVLPAAAGTLPAASTEAPESAQPTETDQASSERTTPQKSTSKHTAPAGPAEPPPDRVLEGFFFKEPAEKPEPVPEAPSEDEVSTEELDGAPALETPTRPEDPEPRTTHTPKPSRPVDPGFSMDDLQ